MIKAFRSNLQERGNYSRESRLARNRAVSKTHERLARDAHKAKDDDKGRRMDALKVWHCLFLCEGPGWLCDMLHRMTQRQSSLPILLGLHEQH